MKSEVLLSLIVPVYNVAPYLESCMQSLVAQDLRDMEIIVVDDGSTDDCPAILERFRCQFPEKILVIRQENGGLSSARNTGLDIAKGRYLAFVDSDDWIDPAYYRRLLNLAIENELDLAHGNAWFHYEARQTNKLIYVDDFSQAVMPGLDVLKARLAAKSLLHMVWMHLYRREFIENLGLRFIHGLIHEDVLWTTRVFLEAKRVSYDPTPGYFYRVRERRYVPEEQDRRFEKVIESSLVNAAGLAEMAEHIADPQLKKLICWQLVDGGMSVFHKLKKIESAESRGRVRRLLKENHFYRLLWKNAVVPEQHRRIARNWLVGLAQW